MNYDVVLNANDNTALETQYAFTQGDYGQTQFSIRVKADGQYVTDASRAYIVFTLSNGMIVTGADMPKSVATYTYVFQGNELQSPGKIVADVKLVYPSGQISSNKFTFTCRPDPLADKNIPAGPYITALQKIVDEGQEKIDYLQALIDTLQEGVGETAVTRNDLQNNRDPVDAGLKAIDANMAQNLFFKSEVINNNTTATAGFAADARQLNPSVPGSLAAQLATANSNLGNKTNASDFAKYNMEYHTRIYLTSGYISGMVNDKISQGYKGGDIALSAYAPPDNYNGNQYGIIQWTLVSSDIAHLRFLVPRSTAIITRAISVSESYDTGWTAH